jgi:cysteine synthase A
VQSEISVWSSDRERFYRSFAALALEHVTLLDTTTAEAAAQGYRNLLWDAAAMPAGGHYFPIYIHLLAGLEQSGAIAPDRTVLVETTTGTAGMALAWLASRLGYRLVLFMPADMPRQRRRRVEELLGPESELILTPEGTYVAGMVHAFRRFMARARHREDGGELFALDHSRRPEAVDALVPIIKAAWRSSGADRIDYAVGALGNGTSSAALFRVARDLNPGVTCVGVEPIEAPMAYLAKYGIDRFEVLFGYRPDPHPHQLLGTGGWGVRFPHLAVEEIDEIIPLHEERWREEQQKAAQRGLDFGNSTAACQAAITALMHKRSNVPFTSLSIRYDTSEVY